MNVGSETTTLPEVAAVNDLFKKSVLTKTVKTTVKKAKKIGVVGVSKAENVQLGLILKEIAYQFKEYNDGSDIYLPSSVLVDPEALIKLFGRYQNKAK